MTQSSFCYTLCKNVVIKLNKRKKKKKIHVLELLNPSTFECDHIWK